VEESIKKKKKTTILQKTHTPVQYRRTLRSDSVPYKCMRIIIMAQGDYEYRVDEKISSYIQERLIMGA